MDTHFKYRAFISYSHSDEQWAMWLHKALETYRVPKHVVGRETEFGPVPTRFAPVFRDRDELATATNLGDTLTRALEQSAFQIVICSPKAAKSRWVNEEILTFKRLGRENRIFALIVDGEPGSSANPATADQECFPSALIYRMGADGQLTTEQGEPIAADAREGKDSKLDVKLKLLAGMLGVGLDELKQREAHRRHVRMMWLVSASLTGMAITSALAGAAWIARNEAQRERARAEAEAETARQTTRFMVDLFKVSDPSESLGNTITAREILDKGAARIETELVDQPAIQATLMDTMGKVYTSLGLYESAVSLVDQSLRKRRAIFGAEHPEVASTLDHLGEVQALKADYDKAEQNLISALAVRRKLLGNSSLEVAETLDHLAYVMTQQAEYKKAEPLIKESLQIRRAALGGKHPDVAKSLEALGLNHFNQGDLANAEPLLRLAVAMRRDLLQNKPHPDLATAIGNLGFVLIAKGDFDEAESSFVEALAMMRKVYGDNHPEIALGMNNVAYVRHAKGDYAGAESMYNDLIAMQRKLLGPNHPDLARSLNNLAFLYSDMGNDPMAMKVATESLEMTRRVFGDVHPEVARSLNAVAMFKMDVGDYAAAEPMLRDSLAINVGTLGDAHPDVADSLTLLAGCLVAGTRYDEARELAGKARKIYSATLPEDNWRAAVALGAEGAALAGLRKYSEAEVLLLRSYGVLKSDPDAMPMFVAQATKYLAELYHDWGKPEQAAKYLKLLKSS